MHFKRQETHHAMIGNNGNYIIYIRICDLEILELLLFMGLAFCLFHNQFEFFDRKPLFHLTSAGIPILPDLHLHILRTKYDMLMGW